LTFWKRKNTTQNYRCY